VNDITADFTHTDHLLSMNSSDLKISQHSDFKSRLIQSLQKNQDGELLIVFPQSIDIEVRLGPLSNFLLVFSFCFFSRYSSHSILFFRLSFLFLFALLLSFLPLLLSSISLNLSFLFRVSFLFLFVLLFSYFILFYLLLIF
jgi:hypothetical protein